MKAKIINNQIIYQSIFMYINSINNYVSNPTDEMLLNDGYKDILYIYTNELKKEFEETDNNIIIYILSE